MADFWSTIFGGQPTSVFDTYASTANSLNTLRKQKIANALNQIKLNYAPQMAQQAADTGAADTSIEQNKAKYAPGMSAAALTNAQNTAHFAPILSRLNVQQKQIENAMSSTKFQEQPQMFQQQMAFKAAQIENIKNNIKVSAQKANTQQGHLGAAFNFRQMLNSLSPAARAAYVASHPDQVNQILGGILGQAANAYPSSPQPNAPAPASFGINPIQNISSMNAQSPSMGAPQNSQVPTGAPQANALQATTQPLPFATASQIAANKSSVTNQTTKRLESSIEIEKILSNPKYDRLAESAAKYAGVGGKIQGGIQAWQKNNPKDYENYLQFRNQFTSMITNVARQLEGLGVQEATRNEITGNLTQAFDAYSSNPARALDQYNRFKDQMTDLSHAASTAAQPIYPGAREKAAGINMEPKANNNAVAKEDNDTVDVISPDGREGSIPTKNLEKALSRGYKRVS